MNNNNEEVKVLENDEIFGITDEELEETKTVEEADENVSSKSE